MDIGWLSLLTSFLVTFQLLFVGIFLVTHRKGRKRNNITLGIIFLLIAWNMGDMTVRVSGLQTSLGFFQLLDDAFFLLYGPLFYVYVQMVIYRDYKISNKMWLHLLPYGLVTIFLIVSFSTESMGPVDQSTLVDLPWPIHFVSYGMYLHIFIYLISGYKSLREYQTIIKNQFSEIDNINLNWLRFTLVSVAVLTLISLVHGVLFLYSNPYTYGISMFLLLTFIFYFVNNVIFKALRQPEIFAGIDKKDSMKYSGSNLTPDHVESIRVKLIQVLGEEKLHLNPQLSISDLAERLNLSSKIVSQVINQSFNKSYFDFINSLRIQEAQNIFQHSQDEKLTVLEVLYRVGFNSKSSFNTAFKKVTGLTPSEFRKKLQEKRLNS